MRCAGSGSRLGRVPAYVIVAQDVEVNLIPINGHEDLCPADYKLVCGDTVVGEDGLPWLFVLSPKVGTRGW